MPTPAPAPADDHGLAGWLASGAGRLLLDIRTKIAEGADASTVKDEGDLRSHELLVAQLGELRPGDAVLSEEGADDKARLDARRVWIVDPLDGTREFGEPPRDDWAVHVALWEEGDLVAGAVALPAMDLTLVTDPPPPTPLDSGRPPRILVSRTRPPAYAEELARRLGGELVPMGSAGAKICAVVRGEADVYAHAGGQWEWDSAAPVAVARAAGLHTSRVDGSPLLYNKPDPHLPDLVVCRPALAEPALEALADLI